MKEIWKEVDGHNDYCVSNYGRVKSFKKTTPVILTLSRNKHGQITVMFSECGKQKRPLVSRLVAIAFLPNPKNSKNVIHINGNIQDNSVTNLMWGSEKDKYTNSLSNGQPTMRERMKDDTFEKIKTGLIKSKKNKGEKNSKSKLKNKDIFEIRKKYGCGICTMSYLATKYGVSIACISSIIKNQTYRSVRSKKKWSEKDRKETDKIIPSLHYGENNVKAKLTKKEVILIRKEKGLSQLEIAKKYNVSKSTISSIIANKTWKHT